MALEQPRVKMMPKILPPADRSLSKGQLLFAEGDTSKAMYLIKRGVVRIFKKKGDSSIELDTIHSGQILGELAFLDGNPRSASAEALTDCVLVEISSEKFTQAVAILPDWLKLLLKTIVGRLRSASTKIRQLEQATTAIDYKGTGSSAYVYVSWGDFMKTSAAIVLVAGRSGKQIPDPKNPGTTGLEVKLTTMQRYANQIMNVPLSKVTSILDILTQAAVISVGDEVAGSELVLKSADFLEQLIAYMNEENQKEPTKRKDLSKKGFIIMSLAARYIGEFEKDAASGLVFLNFASILEKETKANGGRAPFLLDEISELAKMGYCSEINAKSKTEVMASANYEDFMQSYKFQRVVKMIEKINEEKKPKGRAA